MLMHITLGSLKLLQHVPAFGSMTSLSFRMMQSLMHVQGILRTKI